MSKPICKNCGEAGIVLAETHLCYTCHAAFGDCPCDKVPLYGRGSRVIYGCGHADVLGTTCGHVEVEVNTPS